MILRTPEKDKILLHGTLLYSSDLSKVAESLHVDPKKFEDKGIKSVRSRVTTIAPYLKEPLSIEDFSRRIFAEMLARKHTGEPSPSAESAEIYELTAADRQAIDRLAKEKYETWEWVYGTSPAFTYTNSLKYEGGLAEIGLAVDCGRIKEMRITGDFFGEKEIEELYEKLAGIPYEKEAVLAALSGIAVGSFLHGMTAEMLCDAFFSAA